MQKRPLIDPKRARHLERPFGWIPVWIMTDDRFGSLRLQAKVLYTFLCVVSDREGMSCYGRTRMSHVLRMSEEALVRATHELCRGEFICFDGHWYQVLALDHDKAQRMTPAESISASSPPFIAEQGPSQTIGELWEMKHIRTVLKQLGQRAPHA